MADELGLSFDEITKARFTITVRSHLSLRGGVGAIESEDEDTVGRWRVRLARTKGNEVELLTDSERDGDDADGPRRRSEVDLDHHRCSDGSGHAADDSSNGLHTLSTTIRAASCTYPELRHELLVLYIQCGQRLIRLIGSCDDIQGDCDFLE